MESTQISLTKSVLKRNIPHDLSKSVFSDRRWNLQIDFIGKDGIQFSFCGIFDSHLLLKIKGSPIHGNLCPRIKPEFGKDNKFKCDTKQNIDPELLGK
jgi:hypothetical protein